MSEFLPGCLSTISSVPTKCPDGCHSGVNQRSISDADQYRTFFPGNAQVKNKSKRIDRLMGNEALHRDIPMIFRNITSMLTRQLSLCVIAVDWSGYPSQEHHVLRASLLCDGRSIPLLSKVVPSEKQNNPLIQHDFLDSLAQSLPPMPGLLLSRMLDFRAHGFTILLLWAGILLVGSEITFSIASITRLKDG